MPSLRFVNPTYDNPNGENFRPLEERSLAEQARFMIHAVHLGKKPVRAVFDRKYSPKQDDLPVWWDGSSGYMPPQE